MYWRLRVLALALVAGTGALGASALAAAHPGAVVSPQAITCGIQIKLVNDGAGRVWDIEGASPADQTPIQMFDYHDGGNQKWQRCVDGGQGFVLKNLATGKCVDVAGATGADHAPIQLYTCHWNTNQRFELVASGNGYAFRAVHSFKCVDIPGSNWAAGVNLQQYSCNGAENQRFRLAAA